MLGVKNRISEMNAEYGYDFPYVSAVLDPGQSEYQYARIPEGYGRKSTVCRLTDNFSVTTSTSLGQTVMLWLPWYRLGSVGNNHFASYTDGVSVLNVDNLPTIGNLTATRQFGVINPNINHWRLVAAECKISYIGRVDESSGLLSAGLLSEDPMVVASSVNAKTRDGLFSYSGNAQDGVRMIYIPLDVRDTTFYSALAATPSDQALRHIYTVAGYGLPSNKTVFDVCITYIIEYLPEIEQIDYIGGLGLPNSSLLQESQCYLTDLTRSDSHVVISGANRTSKVFLTPYQAVSSINKFNYVRTL